MARDGVIESLKDILDASYPTSGWITASLSQTQAEADRENFHQLQDAYNACVTNTPATGLQHLREVMGVIATLYPVEPASRVSSSLAQSRRAAKTGQVLAYLARAGISTIFNIIPYKGNSTTRVSQKTPNSLHLLLHSLITSIKRIENYQSSTSRQHRTSKFL
jgi:hypothetical protein